MKITHMALLAATIGWMSCSSPAKEGSEPADAATSATEEPEEGEAPTLTSSNARPTAELGSLAGAYYTSENDGTKFKMAKMGIAPNGEATVAITFNDQERTEYQGTCEQDGEKVTFKSPNLTLEFTISKGNTLTYSGDDPKYDGLVLMYQ